MSAAEASRNPKTRLRAAVVTLVRRRHVVRYINGNVTVHWGLGVPRRQQQSTSSSPTPLTTLNPAHIEDQPPSQCRRQCSHPMGRPSRSFPHQASTATSSLVTRRPRGMRTTNESRSLTTRNNLRASQHPEVPVYNVFNFEYIAGLNLHLRSSVGVSGT